MEIGFDNEFHSNWCDVICIYDYFELCVQPENLSDVWLFIKSEEGQKDSCNEKFLEIPV